MNVKTNMAWIASLLFFSAMLTMAAPIRLTVQPQGTNQIELAFSPVIPDVFYEVMVRSNGPDAYWMPFAGPFFGDSNKTISATCNLSGIQGLTSKTFENWKFAAGCWNDSGSGLPDMYQDLVSRTDPYLAGADPYGNLMGDGYVNLQKMQNNMNPFMWYVPFAPVLDVKFHEGANGARHGSAILDWRTEYGTIPDHFLIERANRTMRPMTNDLRFMRQNPYGFNGRSMTNRPPNLRPPYGRPDWRQENPLITGPFEVVARIEGKTGLREYHYEETNVDTLFQPLYRVQAHYPPPPLYACLSQVNASAIRKTILPVTAQPTTNGYALTVAHPIQYSWYLLLVRDKNNPQWRASGYFASGTNRNPVYLQVDKKGMMSGGQSPIAMPEVKFLPDVVKPEFTAGWGEDSDGDGLPDIYEVLVTHSEPDNADTGNIGILDGYKELTDDGWSSLEKFRRRANPLKPSYPPAPVELKHPTWVESADTLSLKTDLRYESQVQIRTNGATSFQPLQQLPWQIQRMLTPRDPHERGNFDLRISWQVPEMKPQPSGGGP